MAGVTLFGQDQAAVPAFEVASIKPAAPFDPALMMAGKAHIGLKIDEARVDIGNLSLSNLLCLAYRVKPYQISAPDWINTQRFDVLAKLPEGASKDQMPEMLQALLGERFKLTLHREDKEHAVYALVVGKNGPKMKEAPPDTNAPGPDGPAPPGPGAGLGQMSRNSDGKGVTIAGSPMGAIRTSMGQDGNLHLEISKATMAMFADMLTNFVDRPVVDMTELKGTYQVALDLSLDDMRNSARAAGLTMGAAGMPPLPPGGDAGRGAPIAGAGSDPASSAIFSNVQKLGLKLEPRKTPVETLVIDHAEKMPTEN
jgi:uncharacterized protein (TIGR03435 family)